MANTLVQIEVLLLGVLLLMAASIWRRRMYQRITNPNVQSQINMLKDRVRNLEKRMNALEGEKEMSKKNGLRTLLLVFVGMLVLFAGVPVIMGQDGTDVPVSLPTDEPTAVEVTPEATAVAPIVVPTVVGPGPIIIEVPAPSPTPEPTAPVDLVTPTLIIVAGAIATYLISQLPKIATLLADSAPPWAVQAGFGAYDKFLTEQERRAKTTPDNLMDDAAVEQQRKAFTQLMEEYEAKKRAKADFDSAAAFDVNELGRLTANPPTEAAPG